MKKKNVLSSVAAMMLFLTGTTLSGASVRQERSVRSFNGISIVLSADVELRQGPATKVILEGPESFLEKVETTVEGGMLKIRFYKKYSGNRAPKGRIRIFITTPHMERIYVTGSAVVKAVTPLHTKGDLKTGVTGSGQMLIPELQAASVKASVTGSGTIRLGGKGSVEDLYVLVTGSGQIRAEELPARNVKAVITGSGNAYVRAEENLKVNITGSGVLHYRGPAIIDAHITGSGNLVKE